MLILITHTCLTFLINVPGCGEPGSCALFGAELCLIAAGRGYLGPGSRLFVCKCLVDELVLLTQAALVTTGTTKCAQVRFAACTVTV